MNNISLLQFEFETGMSEINFEWDLLFDKLKEFTLWRLQLDQENANEDSYYYEGIPNNYRKKYFINNFLQDFDLFHATLDLCYESYEDFTKNIIANDILNEDVLDLEVFKCHHPGCENKFFNKQKRINQFFFCSKTCEWSYKFGKQSAALYKQRTNEINIETVFPLDLLIKQNFTCNFCNEKLSLVFNSFKYSPSIDHIVPISKGGKHIADNIQILHRGCNSKKGNR